MSDDIIEASRRELRSVLLLLSKAAAILSLLWLLFFGADEAFPYIKAGHVIIYSAKANVLCKSLEFPADARHKVLVFGDSTILSGFLPERFDATGALVASFNLGLPDSCRFVDHLDLLVRRGQIPTHVLFSVAWPSREQEGKSTGEPVDKAIMDTVFPFRDLPRNVSLFMLRSRTRGGLRGYYEHGRTSVRKMILDRGYYFIEGQSHFPEDRLPDGFRLQSDQPDQMYARRFDLTSDIFAKLKSLHSQYGIQFCIIPYYYRQGRWAKPSDESPNSPLFHPESGFSVLGPEYFLFPNRYFSDPVHVNHAGAELYTDMVASLFWSHVVQDEAPEGRNGNGSGCLEK